ncbi:MAG: crotonase/enoyl-CoA hydratase family protein [Pseudomonadales bacterium]|nr:crotonase/enoyl-CoA hydratase family protein [Pseudomonadales bacterium]
MAYRWIQWEKCPPWGVVTLQRPEARNAVHGPMARELVEVFQEFDQDPDLAVAILTGSGGHFCAGADLKVIAHADTAMCHRLEIDGDGPMGPTRMRLSKPVIAAISGYCVAGGLELATWCDLRVADESAVLGVFCRRFGVPLIDGGTVRLPRLVGMSHAMDMILTGRAVDAQEAKFMGLVNRLVPKGEAVRAACELAAQIASFPATCMRNDRLSAYEQEGLSEAEALQVEFLRGMQSLASEEMTLGVRKFQAGDPSHGT